MNFLARSVFGALVVSSGWFSATAGEIRIRPAVEQITRLQIFLDRAEFAPGKIDGRFGELTRKALELYRQAHEPRYGSCSATEKCDDALDFSDLDLASVDPVFIRYTVTELDLRGVGTMGKTVPEQAKQKSLPYEDSWEALAEKFHCDVIFLRKLNPGWMEELAAGDELTVPNVAPFELSAVKHLQPGRDCRPKRYDAQGESDGKVCPPGGNDSMGEFRQRVTAEKVTLSVSLESFMLEVRKGDRLVAAYPVSTGAPGMESPSGEWKVRGVRKWPSFRYDEQMLTRGERGSDFHLLPPGPNSPLGVVWIGLNRKGVGIHGTNDPDAIGRAASHGCIRLANWDIVRLAEKVRDEVELSIR